MNRETSLINGLKNRKEQSFRDVYNSYNRLVYYIAFTILKNKEEAEEAMQDTFVRLMETIDSYQDQGKFKQYITKMAKSIAIDRYRKQKRSTSDPYDDNTMTEETDTTADVLLTLEMTLDKDEAYIATLHIVYDFTFREIAEDMNESLGVIQAKYYKAMQKLRKYYKGREN